MDSIQAAFDTYPRELFLPKAELAHAAENTPISIGFGQTNSQPSTVRQLLKWLNVQPGQKVMDVGSGSGWTTALLSHLVGPSGGVYAIERIPGLLSFGQHNCEKANVKNVSFHLAGKRLGLAKQGPYDRILVNAAATMLPKVLLSQLNDGGKMVAPVLNSVFVITKTSDGYDANEHPGYIFVPLIE